MLKSLTRRRRRPLTKFNYNSNTDNMSEDKLPERDSKGDVKFNYGKADWDKIRRSQYTYIFHYYDEAKDHYFPHFGLFSSVDERMEKAKQDPEFFEKQLYWTPDHPPIRFLYQVPQLAIGFVGRVL